MQVVSGDHGGGAGVIWRPGDLELRRTRIGPFSVQDASDSRIIALPEALAFLPAIVLSGEDARRAAHGAPVMAKDSGSGVVSLLDEHGLIALAQRDPDSNALRTVVGFRG